MNLPIFGKPRFTRFVLAVFLLYFLLFHQTACLPPPLNLDCDFCFDGTCGVNTGFVCKDGYCVPEGDPNPARCKTSENTEGGVEKTEPTAESTPEESANPEESTNPEDGAPIDQEPIREEGPEPDIKETDKPYIERVNGNGSQLPVNAAASPSKIDNLPAAPTKPSPSRIKDALVLEGNLLDQIDRWVLQSNDSKNTEQTWANTQIQRDSNMKHTLSLLGRNLVAGSFLLLGFSANTQVVSADVFILQGEKGDAGAKGDIGDNKFTDNDATLLKALLTKLQANGDNLDITANTVTFKSATAQKVTLDLGNNATLKSGNATLDFAGDTITVKSTTFSITANRFEAKGNSGTALVLDDTAKTMTFEKANVRILNGATKTDQANGLGNLIIGYNEPHTTPKNRTGSHNLILGVGHGYESFGSIISGKNHSIQSPHAAVIGGEENEIGQLGESSVSIAGQKNNIGITKNSKYAANVAGQNNTASNTHAANVAGQNNTASNTHAANVAGQNNTASNTHAANVAGQNNTASNTHAANVAGQNNTASGTHAATVGGGGADKTSRGNEAGQNLSVVLGGYKVSISQAAIDGTSTCSSYNVIIGNTRATCCVGNP